MDERDYWLAFSVCPGIGPLRFSQLLEHFGSAETAWNANTDEVKHVIGEHFSGKLEKFKERFSIKLYNDELRKREVSFVILAEKNYPLLLKQIANPPFVLYVKGDLHVLQQEETIGIVGTRKITGYGRTVTEMITDSLVDSGFVIVSGLAMGVDAVAHKTTIDHGGKTIAVLGCGVDCCTPATNQSLYNSIVAGSGAVVSEFPLGQLPTKGSFPSRNRIIAGLSQAVVVTEGAEDSGALITASEALKNNRKVFAVPGPITSSLSKGPNKLLAEGAKLVTSAEDILKEMGIKGIKSIKSIKSIKGDTEEEQKIIDLLQNEPLHFDEIVKRTQFDSAKVGMMLSMMEMRGLIKNMDGEYTIQ